MMFSMYHLAKFSDFFPPLFLIAWFSVVAICHAVVGASVLYYRYYTDKVSPDNDDEDFIDNLVDDTIVNSVHEYIDGEVVYNLMDKRDELVKTSATDAIADALNLGTNSTVDLIIYPRYNNLGNVSNVGHFRAFADKAVIKRYVQ